MNEDAILEILLGQKLLFDGYWHVYDINGLELSDPAGVMWRANPGALIMWPNVDQPTQARRSRRHSVRFERFKAPATTMVDIALLHEEDALVTDLLVALTTQGFFDGSRS